MNRESKDKKKKGKKKKKEEVEEKKEVIEKKHVPIPRIRPTAWDTSGQRPSYWPSRINKYLDRLYEPTKNLFRALEGEREEHQLMKDDPQERPWSLVELAVDAMQMPLLLEGKAKEYYQAVKNLPPIIEDKLQQLLPTDVDVRRAIEVIDDGVFWKRLATEKFPYMVPCPGIQKFSYKSLFIQEWFATYLSEQEPYYCLYNEIEDTSDLVAPFVYVLDIKELKAPIFRKKEAPKADAEPNLQDMSWLKETCLPPFPYVQRIDLSLVLPKLNNLTNLSICFGFSNYERYRCFRKSRINVKDIENLFRGILFSLKLVDLRIYMSAFYETDVRMTVRCLLLFPVLLTKLEISNCELDDRAGRMIGMLILYHISLEQIDIKRNYLTKTGAYFIATALCMTDLKYLKSLNLSENGIGCVGAMYMALMLTVNHTLQGLNLSGCRIGKFGGLLMITCLSLNKGLRSLDLSVNHIGSISNSQEEKIVKNMKAHPRLLDLMMGQCGLSVVLEEFIKVLGREKRRISTMNVENLGTILVRKPVSVEILDNWNAFSRPKVDQNESVYTSESGELTSLGSTISEIELKRDLVPRKKLKRFMKATLTKDLVLTAIQTVLKHIHRMAILRAQRTGKTIKAIFAEELSSVPIKKLIKDEINRVIRKKMKRSKLFSKPEKLKLRTPVPRYVINNVIRNMLERVPRKLVNKVINQTIRKIEE